MHKLRLGKDSPAEGLRAVVRRELARTGPKGKKT